MLTPIVLFALFYFAGVIAVSRSDKSVEPFVEPVAGYETIAIFGASGTAGDGILKAALADPVIKKVHVITRRETPRIEEGVTSGKVQMTLHTDYLDYSAIHEQIAEADTVYCGRSCLVGPDGKEILRAGKSTELLIADVDSQAIASARETNPVLNDRRPDLYAKPVKTV